MSSKPSSIAPETLALGVCNGCQMMSNLRELIPGSDLWPRFVRNQSDRFEARFSLVEVTSTRRCCCRAWPVPICLSRFSRRRSCGSA
ncbi:phosphoribosylformylglycinamidine synthase subunit PurQ [Cedecea neteri]|uniref:phosphoribosylformylglycinamidine synthase subunit PurQ n=1 Tax=Cedecea neteri TaxID=158822 RepID=UPI003AFA830A